MEFRTGLWRPRAERRIGQSERVLLNRSVRPTPHWLVVGVIAAAQSGRALAQSSEGAESTASSGANAVDEPEHAVDLAAVREWTLGVFSQNRFSGGVQLSLLQPFVGYSISPTLSLSIGEPQLTWDWDAGELVAAPVGLQLNVVVPIVGPALRLSANPQLNLIDDPGLNRWSLIFAIGLPVAK